MSIIIHGAKMPESCDSCPLMIWNDYGIDGELQYCNALKAICEHEEGQRDADCPLSEIPPHGRLIDADALIRDLQYDIKLDEEYSHDIGVPCSDEDKKIYQFDKDVKQNCIEFIKATPTITEEEGVKE